MPMATWRRQAAVSPRPIWQLGSLPVPKGLKPLPRHFTTLHLSARKKPTLPTPCSTLRRTSHNDVCIAFQAITKRSPAYARFRPAITCSWSLGPKRDLFVDSVFSQAVEAAWEGGPHLPPVCLITANSRVTPGASSCRNPSTKTPRLHWCIPASLYPLSRGCLSWRTVPTTPCCHWQPIGPLGPNLADCRHSYPE